jgi:hypothetical protein
MQNQHDDWDEENLIHTLKHYLPAQAPLKDFVHHNTLHAFQDEPFFEALYRASHMLGYKTSLSLKAFRRKYQQGEISDEAINSVISEDKGLESLASWRYNMLEEAFDHTVRPQVGKLRAKTKELYQLDMDAQVHTRLFRLLGAYLDQGVSIQPFPVTDRGFLSAIREMGNKSKTSFFRSEKVKTLVRRKGLTMTKLLDMLVADSKLYTTYIFDQQFAHPGWSGMVSFVEDHPNALLDKRRIKLEELIMLELLLEIDVLETKFGSQWKAVGQFENIKATLIFAKPQKSKYIDTMVLWQKAMEESFYSQVLNTLILPIKRPLTRSAIYSFQAFMCIDDREYSLRTYLEEMDSICQTYGTPGHFGLEYYFQPQLGKFHTKVCPAPLLPVILVKEYESVKKQQEDIHFSKHTHGALGAAILTHTVGLWSGIKLATSIFRPRHSSYGTSSFQFMDPMAKLTLEHTHQPLTQDGLQIGFTLDQMVSAVEGVLRSTGLTDLFAPLVYMVAHGASSVNNTYYAGYDCGACCGRPGSVNARLFAAMANKPEVRKILLERGIYIPNKTQFVGSLHDTTKDEVQFYDTDVLNQENTRKHENNVLTFNKALSLNARERSRRFVSTPTELNAESVHTKVKKRAVTLYEPRPELNHASNCLCVIGRPSFTKKVFLDRRAFANSYDYEQDPTGKYLLAILNAVAPVCGGINLEYYFSRVDNEKLGAGSKLPHNVVGLNGVANGVEGDLRPGLPVQMTELHDPLRLMVVIEHFPEVVLDVIKRNPATYQWFKNEWVVLSVIDPETKSISRFKKGEMEEYTHIKNYTQPSESLEKLILNSSQNLPVHRIS